MELLYRLAVTPELMQKKLRVGSKLCEASYPMNRPARPLPSTMQLRKRGDESLSRPPLQPPNYEGGVPPPNRLPLGTPRPPPRQSGSTQPLSLPLRPPIRYHAAITEAVRQAEAGWRPPASPAPSG